MYIYKIVNKINGKIYIGKSVNWKERKRTHLREYKKENIQTKLYRAMRLHGEENFEFSIVEECNNNIWEEREQYWIEYYNSINDGYNMIPGGTEPPHFKNEDHPLSKLTWKDIHQIKDLLKNSNKTMRQISNNFNISIDQIYRINTGESWSEEGDSFPIRTRRTIKENIDEVIDLLQNSDLTQKRIGEMFGFSRTTITAINCGQNHYNKELTYPLRTGRRYSNK